MQEVEKSSDGLILKELPKDLKYAFLGEEKSKPVIIAFDLTSKKKEGSGKDPQKIKKRL